MTEKTHYRKVYKSDHLAVADLEDLQESGSNLCFTITHVKQEIGVKVAGRKGNFNVAYFNEKIKPLVLNATNAKVLKTRTGSTFVEDWHNLPVQLYVDPSVKFNDNEGGVRINPNYVEHKKPELTPDNTNMWANAIAALKRDGNLDAVFQRMTISKANQSLLHKEAAQ